MVEKMFNLDEEDVAERAKMKLKETPVLRIYDYTTFWETYGLTAGEYTELTNKRYDNFEKKHRRKPIHPEETVETFLPCFPEVYDAGDRVVITLAISKGKLSSEIIMSKEQAKKLANEMLEVAKN